MPRARDALLAAVFAACTPAPESAPPSPTAEAPEAARPTPPAGRTANEDRRGFASQPDYDAEATLLKEQVTPRLPATLARDRKTACAAMWAAADLFYSEIEPDEQSRAQTWKLLQATRAADLAACERETSVRAAECVTVLLGDRNAELPWLLDQCSRAFPE
jgi:hypothetical protein